MNPNLILLPVLVQILVVVVLYFYLAAAKARAARNGEVDEARRALFADAWPEPVIQINNCIRNQFEVPVLFYVLALMLWGLNAVDPVSLGLAWLFVVSRLAHAYVHTGTNYVPLRRRIFSAGVIVLLILWAWVVLSILGGT